MHDNVVETDSCPVCDMPANGLPELHEKIGRLRAEGRSAEAIWDAIGRALPRALIERHCRHVPRGVATAVAEAVDAGQPVGAGYLERHGIVPPADGVEWVAATVKDGDHWVRVRPETAGAERLEIRQAQPVVVEGYRPQMFTALVPGSWQTWVATPDAQIGYWRDERTGEWHTTHDERAFDLTHNIAHAVASDEGVHGWIDPGDFADLAAPSRHNPTATDLHVEGLNRTWQRGGEELAIRRWTVGDEGEVVLLEGNHDLRLKKRAASEMPYLVGMRRADDPEDEHPILSVPYLMRARDYGVEWVPGYPSTYRLLNSNLAVFHAPAYGSKALDTARKIAARVHLSVYHGHTHRRESLAETIETASGARTLEVWSDGTLGRVDAGLPSERNGYDDYMSRLTVEARPKHVGMLGENFHQGISILHVEVSGRERFSVERVAYWDGWAQFRGVTFTAGCDVDGKRLEVAS